MPISFDFIPSALRTPGAYAEFDNSQALRGLLPGIQQRLLVMGQKLPAGAVAELTPTITLTAEAAAASFGRGSMLHRMMALVEANNKSTEVIAIAIDDLAAGALAAGDIAFAGSVPTEAGTLNLMIAGRRIRVGVATTDTADNIATNVAAAITADADGAVTAVVNGVTASTVDISARHKGENGNDIDVRLNYFDGELLPAGVAAIITALSGGTGNPDVAEIITVIAGEQYDYMILPWTDAANLSALETDLATRYQPMVEMEGLAFSAKSGTQGELTTFGNGRNSEHVSIMGLNGAPTPPEEIAAAFGAVAAFHLNIDPARPLQTLILKGVRAPAVVDRFTQQERNILLFDGIATSRTSRDGAVWIERAITTYQDNPQGAPDPSYLDINTLATLTYLRFSWRNRMLLKFPRHKLADDGTRFGAGQAIATPGIIKGETVALARLWEAAGLVENIDQFKNELIVERDQGDVNRINLRIPPDIVNQLRILAARFEFIL